MCGYVGVFPDAVVLGGEDVVVFNDYRSEGGLALEHSFFCQFNCEVHVLFVVHYFSPRICTFTFLDLGPSNSQK